MKKIVQIILLASVEIVFGQTMASAEHDLKGPHDFQGQQSLCIATLIAQNPNARINLRSGPGTYFESEGYGLVGDNVYILSKMPPEADYAEDRQGNLWYRVGFPRSGASGWIREDFLKRLHCDYD